MTKKQIIKWLDLQETKKQSELTQSKKREMEKYYENIFENESITRKCDELQEIFCKMTSIYEQLLETCKTNSLSSKKGWTVFDDFYSYVNGKHEFRDYVFKTTNRFVNDKREGIITKYRILANKTRQNFSILVDNVRSRKDAKTAVAYLKHIGFDTSDLEEVKQPATALALNVNPTYLFPSETAA